MSESGIFNQAIKVAPDRRPAFLEQACGSNVELRRELESLLRAHDDSAGFLREVDARPQGTVPFEPIAERPGTIIGPYKLMEQIGEGGMGLVFVAEQQQPVRRKVALKIIKPGMDTREVIARFEAERQALALMDHPNIARVLDAGATESGRPYFVMELVRGIPIVEYCDQQHLSPRDRLTLFVSVCRAVQHAHGKGIIHRDLKPSNILVAPHDGVPVVKVIDFGVAKAIGQQLTEKTIYTRFAQMIGTPLYMAPEQAEVNALDVDVRSDIYSLGVLLYELLTGSTPFDKQRFATAAYEEIRRIIKEEEPPKPSVRLSTSGEIARLAASRQTDPGKLSRLVRGELDWVVMKCLEKDRTRRYETANGLARDVERYLNDEPVEACPPSATYRLKKLYRKNRTAVIATIAILAASLLAAFGQTWNLLRARRAESEAKIARVEAEVKAQELLENTEKLNGANAAMDLASQYVILGQWRAAEAEYNRAINLRSDHSQVWMRRGDFYAGLGLWDLAADDYAKSAEFHAPESIHKWYQHAVLQLIRGDEAGYRRTCREMVERFGETSNAATRSGTRARAILIRACSLRPDAVAGFSSRFDPQQVSNASHYHPWFALHCRALGHFRAGRFDEATRNLRESLAKTNYQARAVNHPVLAMALYKSGQIDAARQELAQSRQEINRWIQSAIRSGAKPVPWEYWHDWADFQILHAEAHRLIEGSPPPADPRMHILRGRAHASLGRIDQAAPEYAKAVALARNDFAIHAETFKFYADAKRWDEAEAEVREMTRIKPNDPQVHVEAFRGFADNGYMEQAYVVLAAGIRLRPEDVSIRLERFRYHVERDESKEAEAAYTDAIKGRENDIAFRIKCGDFCATLKQWAKARDEYARIVDAGIIGDGEMNRNTWLRLAGLQLYLDDVEGYRRTCSRLVDKYEEDSDFRNLIGLVRICLLHPDPGVPPARIGAFFQRLQAQGGTPSHGMHTAAMIALRLGKEADLNAIEQAWQTHRWATQRIAMARVHHSRGDFAAARNLMKQVKVDYRRVDPTVDTGERWDFALENQLWYRQAEAIIQTERWNAAEELTKQQQWSAAIDALTALLKPEDKSPSDWGSRGSCYAALGRWPEAAADFEVVFRLGGEYLPRWRMHTLVVLQVNDRERYRQICRAALDRYAHSSDRQTLNTVAWLCALDPSAEAEVPRALAMADKALNQSKFNIYVHTRACLLYRAKRYDEALKQLNDLIAQPGYTVNAYDWLFLSMIHHRLGDKDKARVELDKAIAWMAANPANDWRNRVELERFRAEAEALIGSSK